jgi:hypothetical protein
MFSKLYNIYERNPDEQGDYVRMDSDEKNIYRLKPGRGEGRFEG